MQTIGITLTTSSSLKKGFSTQGPKNNGIELTRTLQSVSIYSNAKLENKIHQCLYRVFRKMISKTRIKWRYMSYTLSSLTTLKCYHWEPWLLTLITNFWIKYPCFEQLLHWSNGVVYFLDTRGRGHGLSRGTSLADTPTDGHQPSLHVSMILCLNHVLTGSLSL